MGIVRNTQDNVCIKTLNLIKLYSNGQLEFNLGIENKDLFSTLHRLLFFLLEEHDFELYQGSCTLFSLFVVPAVRYSVI